MTSFDAAFQHTLAELFAWRRDVRRFRTDPVDEALLRRCLDLAAFSPSVGNSQPWRFVRVSDPERRAGVVASFERCNADAAATYEAERRDAYIRLKLAGLREAPVHLAVFCDESTEAGHGLGVGWVSILEPETVCGIIGVSCDWHLVAYLCVGFPVEEHADPELVRHGWQERLDAGGMPLIER